MGHLPRLPKVPQSRAQLTLLAGQQILMVRPAQVRGILEYLNEKSMYLKWDRTHALVKLKCTVAGISQSATRGTPILIMND